LWWAVWWWTFPERTYPQNFTHEPNEVVPAKAQAGWEESSSLISKKRQMTSFMLLCKKSLKRDLVVSTDGCQEKLIKPNPNASTAIMLLSRYYEHFRIPLNSTPSFYIVVEPFGFLLIIFPMGCSCDCSP
jgi:hypothetical protein